MENSQIINQLKQQGRRITKARKQIIGVLLEHRLPVTELQLRSFLNAEGVNVNKTTIYRELVELKSLGVIGDVEFGDGKKRYELDRGDHHHHLICTGCGKVDETRARENLRLMEKSIKKQKQFSVSSHSLEFFGLCRKCSANNN